MGIEPHTNSPEYPTNPALGDAKSGALAHSSTVDPAVALLVDAWPTLPEPIKAGILGMIRAVGSAVPGTSTPSTSTEGVKVERNSDSVDAFASARQLCTQ